MIYYDDSILLPTELDALIEAISDCETIVMCGVFRGGDVYSAISEYPNKNYVIVDSFCGLQNMTDQDSGVGHSIGDFAFGLDNFISKLNEYNLKVPSICPMTITADSLKQIEINNIDLVWLDLDLYQPTFDCIEYFKDRLSPKGRILTHDYGEPSTPGIQKACDKFGKWNQLHFRIWELC